MIGIHIDRLLRELLADSTGHLIGETQGQARTLVGASINWTDPSGLRVSLYGRNLLDETYRVSANSVAGLFNFTNYAPPRSYGVELWINY